MCDPVSLTIAATAISAAGTAYTGYSAYQEAQYKSQVANNNAALSRDQARDAELRGQDEEQRQWRKVGQTKSAQIAAMAAAGIDTTYGTAADITGDTVSLGTEDAQIIRENAGRETRGFLIDAQNFKEEGKAQKRAGTQALVSTAFDIGSTVLGGASQLNGMKLPTPKSRATPFPSASSAGFSAWGAPYARG